MGGGCWVTGSRTARSIWGRGGWTILESILSLSLAAAVIAAAAGLARTAMRAATLTESRLEVSQGARRAIERVTEELRWAEAVLDDPACPPSQLCPSRVRVRIPRGNPYRQNLTYDVTFQHNPRQREVERRVGLGVNNLAANIDSVTFTYLMADGMPASLAPEVAKVHVVMQVRHGGGAAVTIEGEVGLRNRRAAFATPPFATPTPWSTWRPSVRGPTDPVPPEQITPVGPPMPSEPR